MAIGTHTHTHSRHATPHTTLHHTTPQHNITQKKSLRMGRTRVETALLFSFQLVSCCQTNAHSARATAATQIPSSSFYEWGKLSILIVFFSQQFKDNVKVFKLALDLVQSLNHRRLHPFGSQSERKGKGDASRFHCRLARAVACPGRRKNAPRMIPVTPQVILPIQKVYPPSTRRMRRGAAQ